MTNRHRQPNSSTTATQAPALPTFMDHVRELQGRLFVVAIGFIAAAGVAYLYFDKLANIILKPLGKDQELVYLTPGGAFSFIIKVSMYVGIVGVLPILIYQLYKFIVPAMRPLKMRTALMYSCWSLLLAAGGIIFAYYIGLPAALYFLTGFDLYHINPMLTIDSYFSFVMTYLLAGALLFQLPLIMLIVNSVKPLGPKQLMKYQDKMLLISFIIAAIISPTPDALNQALLASPMVVMYQVGIVLIAAKRFKVRQHTRKHVRQSAPAPTITPSIAQSHRPIDEELTLLPPKTSQQPYRSPLIRLSSPRYSTVQPLTTGLPSTDTSYARTTRPRHTQMATITPLPEIPSVAHPLTPQALPRQLIMRRDIAAARIVRIPARASRIVAEPASPRLRATTPRSLDGFMTTART